MGELIGIGLYTPAEAGRLLQLSSKKITRWLRGHRIGDRDYEPLWTSQIDLDDGRLYLGFRDLMEVRVADRFISEGVSPQRVRAAIHLAREILGEDRPLSTKGFRTDGRDIFYQVVETDEHGEQREHLLDLFRRQYAFKQIMEPLLRTIDFDEHGAPLQWWPAGRDRSIVIDPARAFGQPLDANSSVPTAILANAGRALGIEEGARAYAVSAVSVKRAMTFEEQIRRKSAA